MYAPFLMLNTELYRNTSPSLSPLSLCPPPQEVLETNDPETQDLSKMIGTKGEHWPFIAFE
jgi:hypothetical protein